MQSERREGRGERGEGRGERGGRGETEIGKRSFTLAFSWKIGVLETYSREEINQCQPIVILMEFNHSKSSLSIELIQDKTEKGNGKRRCKKSEEEGGREEELTFSE